MNEPVPVVDSVIVPIGVTAGAGYVSVTVIVQRVELFTTVLIGLHNIAMLVVLKVEFTGLLIPLLVECMPSPL